MSDCRMCDTCGSVFSVLDIDARRMSVEEPVQQKGSALSMQTVVRDMCGACFTIVNAGSRVPLAQIGTGRHTAIEP